MKSKFLCSAMIFCCLFLIFASPAICADKQHTLSNLKNGFTVLYSSEWKTANFNYRLFRIIDKEFEDTTETMPYGMSGIQLAMDTNRVIEKILDETFAIFQPEYELFFKDFYDKYYTYLEASPVHFSEEKIKELFLYEEVAALQPEVWKKSLNIIGAKVRQAFPIPYLGICALILGLLIILSRGLLTKNFERTKHRLELRIKLLAVLGGIAVMVLGGVQISEWLIASHGSIRDFIYEEAKAVYTSELPETYWNFLEPYIEEALN